VCRAACDFRVRLALCRVDGDWRVMRLALRRFDCARCGRYALWVCREPRSFDVICAGEPAGNVGASAIARFRAGDGIVSAAALLARQGLRVGLATVVADDVFGRALVANVAAIGVDTGGVELWHPRGIVLVEGARHVVALGEGEAPTLAIPPAWSSRVLLLSGLSPVLAHAAALCRAARAARRAGTIVVVDVNVRWHLWRGRDSRAIRMVLREADVVWCSAEDLVGLELDVPALGSALRASAVLAVSDGAGTARATGPFGEAVRPPRGERALGPLDDGAAFAAAICAELARARDDESGSALWSRALDRGYAAAAARRTS
jgi:sugar/nucleoside kinase (ribokinase family)